MERNLASRVDAYLKSQDDIHFMNVHGSPFQKKGMPDRQGNVGPVAFYLELKQPGNEPSAIQRGRMRALRKTGAMVTWADNLEDVVAFIEKCRSLALDIKLAAL